MRWWPLVKHNSRKDLRSAELCFGDPSGPVENVVGFDHDDRISASSKCWLHVYADSVCSIEREMIKQMSASAHDGVAVIKPGQTYVGKQGFTYGAGASAETVGAQKVCMNILPMPAGAVAKAHYHKGIETIAFMPAGD